MASTLGGGAAAATAAARRSIHPMPEQILRPYRRTNPAVWLAAVLCAVVAIAVAAAGVLVLAFYLIYHPTTPRLRLASAQLLRLVYDRSGRSLDAELAITILAENGNGRTRIRFSGARFAVRFQGIEIADLRADAFDVPPNASFPLAYVVRAFPVPLGGGAAAAAAMDAAQDSVPFDIKGRSRTRWRLGWFIQLRSWSHLSCRIEFFRSNGSTKRLDCH